MCGATVPVPLLADVIAARGITGHSAAVLEAVWRGKGMPVVSQEIFDAMYADDPDGGPSPTRMYLDLRKAIDGLNARLNDSGVAVAEAGFRQGFRLNLSVVS